MPSTVEMAFGWGPRLTKRDMDWLARASHQAALMQASPPHGWTSLDLSGHDPVLHNVTVSRGLRYLLDDIVFTRQLRVSNYLQFLTA